MAERLQRTQILLEPGQHEALTEMARRQGRSLSDLVRDIVRHHLKSARLEREDDNEQYQHMLEGLRRQHAEILAERDGRPLDLGPEMLDELRQEQDERNLEGFPGFPHRD